MHVADIADLNTPLSYKFYFYLGEDEYDTERELGNSPINVLRNALTDFSN